MGFGFSSHRSSAAALTISWRGVPRTWRIGPVVGIALLLCLPLAAVWFVGATTYAAFHDQLLASLISRQADIQYDYEDRIAVLRTQLDRESSKALLGQQLIATTIRDLASRSRRLEERATTIDALVHDLPHGATAPVPEPARSLSMQSLSALSPFGANAMPSPAALPGLRLDGANRTSSTDESTTIEKRVERDVPEHERLAAALAGVEARQVRQIAALRDPMLASIERLQTALVETGLPSRLWAPSQAGRGIGGPFEPLPDAARGISFDNDVSLLKEAVSRYAILTQVARSVPLRRPLEGPLEVTSPFGARLDPFYGRAAMHTGIDLMEAYGGPVRATAGGTVTVAGAEGGYGNMVEIDHGNGVRTRYAHLSSIEVVPGQKVTPGAIVGLCGSTGRATGPHLHYETRINGEPVDPARFLKAGAMLFRG